MLDYIEEAAPEEETVAMVLEFSRFCRKRPELALLLTALSYATQPHEQSEPSSVV